MNYFLILCTLLFTITAGALAQNPSSSHEPTFEQSYALLEQKLDQLKSSGKAVNEETRKEIAALMAQLNHQHAQLKRVIEEEEQKASSKMSPIQETSRDWKRRIKSAAQEVGDGFKQAWGSISGNSKSDDDKNR